MKKVCQGDKMRGYIIQQTGDGNEIEVYNENWNMANDINETISGEPMFETMFRWKQRWATIIVKPMFDEGRFLHYIVKWIDGPVFFLWKNKYGLWEEMKKGCTERAWMAGNAIENSCLI